MNRVKLLCAILLIIIAGNLYQGVVLSFIEGVKYGFAIVKYETDHKNITDDFSLMEIVAKDANYLDSTQINNKTGQHLLVRSNNISLLINSQTEKPIWVECSSSALWNIYSLSFNSGCLDTHIGCKNFTFTTKICSFRTD